MSGATKVILITGFLGSGKTTFLNRITKTVPENQKLMILMNEFGEVGLDGTLVEGDDMDILEISKGSIFCVCVKTDFIRALSQIASKIKPDVLIVESTGVANPTALKKDLKLSIFKDRFQMKDQICIIDADCFEDAFETFASVEKQIESSSLFVINKTDLVDGKSIETIKQIVRNHHPSPEFYETTYSDIPTERFFGPGSQAGTAEPEYREQLSEQELEAAIEELLENPDTDAVPPDRLMSAVYHWKGSGIDSFERVAEKLPRNLIRSKGILSRNGDLYLFNRVMSRYTIEPYTPDKDFSSLLNKIVFIGPPDVIMELESLSRNFPELEKLSEFDPMVN